MRSFLLYHKKSFSSIQNRKIRQNISFIRERIVDQSDLLFMFKAYFLSGYLLNLPIIHTGADKVYNIMNKHTCHKKEVQTNGLCDV